MSSEPRANLLFKEVVRIAPDGQRFGKDIAGKKHVASDFRCSRATNPNTTRQAQKSEPARGIEQARKCPVPAHADGSVGRQIG
jgi:hypothetical protein